MATTEQFSLRWNNFHSNLTSGFHELLEAAEMVDVTLAVDGHFFQAHKIVLSICSPYFKQMFKVNPCKHPIVILKDVGHENMKDILEFMYMGEVSVLRENLTQFLRTAELLQVKGLTGDDSSEETSSTKDNKAECDNDEENEIYNQLIETDVELPIYSSSPTQVAATPPVVKRPSKNTCTSTNSKRSKSEPHQSHSNQQKPVKQELEPVKPKNDYNNSEYVNVDSHSSQTILNVTKPETEESKEAASVKNIWENSIGATGSGDLSSSDQVINYGAYFLGICGILQLVANLVWLVVRNPNPLVIPFEEGNLETKFGFNYWATFTMGIICLILSAGILFMDYKYDQQLYDLFGVNPLNSYDEVAYLTKEERQLLRPKNSVKAHKDIPLVEMTVQESDDEEDVDYVPVYLKRRTAVAPPKVVRSNKPSHLIRLPSHSQSTA